MDQINLKNSYRDFIVDKNLFDKVYDNSWKFGRPRFDKCELGVIGLRNMLWLLLDYRECLNQLFAYDSVFYPDA